MSLVLNVGGLTNVTNVTKNEEVTSPIYKFPANADPIFSLPR